jgi:hypothetical protein
MVGVPKVKLGEDDCPRMDLDWPPHNRVAERGLRVVRDWKLPVRLTSVLVPTDEPGLLIRNVP